jgi:large subunit ribosomal protein L6
MSRVGKKPILIPPGVEIKTEGQRIVVKGPKGEIQREVRPEIKIEVKEGKIIFSPQQEIKKTNAFWGLTRALIFNMVKGVTDGYEKKLQIEGVGYRAGLEGDSLVLKLGFSHPVKVKQPEGIKFLVEKNIVSISGIDKELVGQSAAKIRKISPPEPYKGTGIRYFGEVVRRKAGKKVVTAGGT